MILHVFLVLFIYNLVPEVFVTVIFRANLDIGRHKLLLEKTQTKKVGREKNQENENFIKFPSRSEEFEVRLDAVVL